MGDFSGDYLPPEMGDFSGGDCWVVDSGWEWGSGGSEGSVDKFLVKQKIGIQKMKT